MNTTIDPLSQEENLPAGVNLIGPRILAIIALMLWCASLAFPAIVLKNHVYGGLQILVMGWMGVIFLLPAWLANPFFMYAFFRQLSGKAAPIAALFAVLLGLSTFLVDRILMDEGGGKDFVYGYGPGAIFWLLGMFTMMLATGWLMTKKSQNSSRWPLLVALTSITGFVSAVTIFAVYDHATANETERMALANVVFKNGPVCSVADPKPAYILNLNGRPLLLVNAAANADAERDAKELLTWGVPSVRIGSFDYSPLDGDPEALIAKPAIGPAGARLDRNRVWVRDSQTGGSTVTIKLSSSDGKNVVFDQTYTEWMDDYCPVYSDYSNVQQQPRKLIMQSLGIKNIPPAKT